MIVPKIDKPSELLTPEEREERYGQRSLADLRRDVNELWNRNATALTEKNRQQGEILGLKSGRTWTLSLAALSFFMGAVDLGILCYLSWH
jgi:hypothetical protein